MIKKYKSEIYRSIEGRHILHSLYRTHLIAANVPLTERMVETRFGDTHVVLYGNPRGTPVLFFAGENVLMPLAIRPFARGLDLEKILLIAPDLPGHIGFSTERKLSFAKGEYGEWACEVMDALDLHTTPVMGYSFGGSLALQLCKKSLLRVERLLLVLPSGIVSTPTSKINRLFFSTFKKPKEPTDDEIREALQPVLHFEQKDLVEAFKMIVTHSLVEKTGFDKLSRKDMLKFKSPVFVVGEKSDWLFPGDEIIKYVRKIFPNMDGTRLLTSGSHYGLFNEEDDDLKECFEAMTNFILRENSKDNSLF
jgi:pimeloyl-ACP methyl ester carboxylesterase